MAIIKVPERWLRLPTDREEEEGRKFSVYCNYLRATSDVIAELHSTDDALVTSTAGTAAYQRIQVGAKCRDPDLVGRLLRISWFTEVQLRLQSQHPELVPYANHFAPVYAYYSIYHSLRALHAASGENVPGDHASVLNAIANKLQTRPNLFPLPWRLLATGDPSDKVPSMLSTPPGLTLSYVNPLTNPREDSRWDLLCQFLRTTRKKRLDDRIESWKKRERRRRILANERAALLKNLLPTSLFDCLYRLRIRANYRDADAVLIGGQELAASLGFHRCLTNIVHSSLLMLETLSARYLGTKVHGELVDDFRQYDKKELGEEGVYARWDAIQSTG